jgi:hypothetical protein
VTLLCRPSGEPIATADRGVRRRRGGVALIDSPRDTAAEENG